MEGKAWSSEISEMSCDTVIRVINTQVCAADCVYINGFLESSNYWPDKADSQTALRTRKTQKYSLNARVPTSGKHVCEMYTRPPDNPLLYSKTGYAGV